MRLFNCQSCGQAIYFENRFCNSCGHALGYLPITGQLAALEPEGDHYVALTRKKPLVRYCENIESDTCNWLIPAGQESPFCLACRHNRTIPDLSLAENLPRWQQMEIAKHRLFYTLIALKLPLKNRTDDPDHGLAFDFLTDEVQPVLTGHEEGLVTINLAEADDAYRETLRNSMGEPYRTLLGHFRHEVGHYFWDLLVRDSGRLEDCRALFGDDSEDYATALQRHYAEGPPPGWQNNFISAYASAHPWEDFAESWAHYLHIVDTLETASTFGLRIHPLATKNKSLHADLNFDPHQANSIKTIIDAWLPLTFAMNNLNRSMGYSDLYPFILSEPVIAKMQFIHEIIRASQVERKPPSGRRKSSAPLQTPPLRDQPTQDQPLQDQPLQAAPEQPPAPPPTTPMPPNPPPPGPDIPPENPPVVEPPHDPLPDTPPIELPPGPDEHPSPIPDEIPPRIQIGVG